METPSTEELLPESAPLAWELAPRLCRKDPATGESCSWYHGIWQFLRIMGLTSSAAQRAEFYHREIGAACAGSPAPRILISGTADYAMLALVIAAFRDRNTRPVIAATDMCETPLHLSRWYAERSGCAIATFCGDILEYQDPDGFDVICTDGFFSRFPAARRPALVAKWQTLLRKGGRVISTNRLHPGSTDERSSFSSARTQQFLEDARRIALEKRGLLRIETAELLRGMKIYAEKHDTYPLASMDEIRALFESSGFSIDTLSAISRVREQPGAKPGAAAGKEAMQMHVVASRL
jgi:hypothetical protein